MYVFLVKVSYNSSPYSVNANTLNLEIKFDILKIFFISVCEDTLHDF